MHDILGIKYDSLMKFVTFQKKIGTFSKTVAKKHVNL